MSISVTERERLFKQVKALLGAPIRKIELTDDMLLTLLEISIENLTLHINNFLIDNQWSSLYGKDISTTDMTFALTTRSIDLETQASYAYSKQVGEQARGPWELKKDFITIEVGKQNYQIPAHRELNEVLFITPNSTEHALYANYGGFDYGFAGGYGQVGGGANVGGGGTTGAGGYYIAPAFDVLLKAQDFNLKNRLLRSELAYKLTAGPNGTRILHLLSTPGSKLSFGAGGASTSGGLGSSVGLVGCQVWYYYYDTSGGDTDECRRVNKDIIKLPNEVPLERLSYDDLNSSYQITVRQLLVAEAKRTLGRVRGKFSGSLGIPGAEEKMDYESLLSEGNEELKEIITQLNERLVKLSFTAQIERKANEAEQLNRHLKFRPNHWHVI